MPLHPVVEKQALPPGSVTEVRVGGESYALCNIDGAIYCVAGACPHAGGPLAQGMLIETTLICPWHGWEFDCRTGESTRKQSPPVSTYAVVVRDGWIHVDVPASRPQSDDLEPVRAPCRSSESEHLPGHRRSAPDAVRRAEARELRPSPSPRRQSGSDALPGSPPNP